MEIKTKYKLRDIVWFMSENKAHRGEILGVKAEINIMPKGPRQDNSYSVKNLVSTGVCDFPEYVLFPTKEDLLNSL